MITIPAASLPALKLASIKVTDAVKGKLTSGNYKQLPPQYIYHCAIYSCSSEIGIAIILNSQIS